jgi:hypothetical protein
MYADGTLCLIDDSITLYLKKAKVKSVVSGWFFNQLCVPHPVSHAL